MLAEDPAQARAPEPGSEPTWIPLLVLLAVAHLALVFYLLVHLWIVDAIQMMEAARGACRVT